MSFVHFLTFTFLSLNLSSAFAIVTTDDATEMVNQMFKQTLPMKEKKYCVDGIDETCRIMYVRKDRITGQPSFFYDQFYSKNRKVGSICYFVPTRDDKTQFHVFSDTKLNDYTRKIDLINPLMAKIVYSHDLNNVFFYNLKMPRLGTTKAILAKMIESDSLVYLEGTVVDSTDPNFREPIRIDYKRVR